MQLKKNSLYIVFFAISLIPYSVDSYSVNYLFVLLPAILLLVGARVYKPDNFVSNVILIYICVFFLSKFVLFSVQFEFPTRALISFMLFMSVFSYSFMKVSDSACDAFRLATILMAIGFSVFSIVAFFGAGGNFVGYEQKGIVGSQRFGFVYLVAFFVLLKYRLQGQLKLLGLTVLLSGLLLTFSRASVVAFVLTGVCYLFFDKQGGVGFKRKSIYAVSFAAVFGMVATYITSQYFPLVVDFFYDRLWSRIVLAEDLGYLSGDTSEGTRLEIWQAIGAYVMTSPVVGSGYLGTWVLSDITAGSAHSQYFDVLLRVGVLGFLAHIALLYVVAKTLWRRHVDFFWGLTAMLIYGLFHETYKLSQGAFILAFFIGLYVSDARDKRRLGKRRWAVM